jgi:hypothetical protein
MSRLTNLDNRVLGREASPRAEARQAWGRKHGWSLALLLGLVLLGISAWALTSRPDHPATAAMTLGFGSGYVFVAAWLFCRRNRS